ncbi:hypothetical protein QVD17_30285 [Tagetes erecta]|uniref:Reverse transcriptase zinc-binding domain-containing protein n=1 Tax=Tagetes erecta TaxID=13708 RepID=A0AAD8K2F5_TARER|nr:hypothetical protein QVD17_30285 [Tagetes erecta]
MALQETQFEDPRKIQFDSCWGNISFEYLAIGSTGRSGGLACLWNPYIFTKIDSFADRYYLWVKGRAKGISEALNIVNVYCPQEPILKRRLWQTLLALKEVHDGLWVLLGDFNSVRFPSERLNSQFCKSSTDLFNQFIDDGKLKEYSMGGRRFTYMTKDGKKLSKIDRILVCNDFFSYWPDASLIALPRDCSDHCPVMLNVQVRDFGPIPFKIFNSCLLKPGADQIVSECLCNQQYRGHPDRKLLLKFREVKNTIKKWLHSTKEHELAEVKMLRETIEKLELAAEHRVLSDLESQVRLDSMSRLQEIEHLKRLDLKQKSRVKWAVEGDENSNFFHGMMNCNSADKRINGLYIDGTWNSDPNAIKEQIFGHFKDRFSEKILTRPKFCSNNFKKLSNDQAEFLIQPFSKAENIIKNKRDLEAVGLDVNSWINTTTDFCAKHVRQKIEDVYLPSAVRVFHDSKWVPDKVNLFVWRATINRIPTKSAFLRRGIHCNGGCQICGNPDENPYHILVNCVVASKVWDAIFSWCNMPKTNASSIENILKLPGSWPLNVKQRKIVYAVFLTTFWGFWLARNENIFQQKTKKAADIVADIKSLSFL